MRYDFKSQAGATVERWYDGTGKVPRTIQIDKVRYKRMPSFGALLNRPMVQQDTHFVSHSRPRWDKNHKGEFNAQGQPLFSKRSEVNDLVARVNHNDSGYDGAFTYDG